MILFSSQVISSPQSIQSFKHNKKVIDYFPETCRENMIFLCSATWACISCLQIVICWQGLCHDTTHLSLPSAAERCSFFFLMASNLLPLANCLLLHLHHRQRAPECDWQMLTFPLTQSTSLDSEYSTFDKLSRASFPPQLSAPECRSFTSFQPWSLPMRSDVR